MEIGSCSSYIKKSPFSFIRTEGQIIANKLSSMLLFFPLILAFKKIVLINQLWFLLMHIVEFLKRQRHAYDTRLIILILHLNFCLSHPRITKGISENSLDVHIESIFRMSWSLLLLVPSPCRICHLLIRGDMCGFSFPLFSPLAAALGFSLAPRRLGKNGEPFSKTLLSLCSSNILQPKSWWVPWKKF